MKPTPVWAWTVLLVLWSCLLHRRVRIRLRRRETVRSVSPWTSRISVSYRAFRACLPGRRLLQGFVSLQGHPLFNLAKRLRERLSSGSFPFGGSGSKRLHPDGHVRTPASAGFGYPLDAFHSASGLPGVFRPGLPMGFTPSGLFPPSGCPDLSARTDPRDAFLPSYEQLGTGVSRVSLRRKPTPAACLFGDGRPLPSWGCASSGSLPDRSPRFSNARLLRLSRPASPKSCRTPASQGHQPAGRIDFRQPRPP